MSKFDTSKRLISLDMLRGLTIALMIVVNDPGSWDHVYWPLLHADWNGITITDFVYPFFIFIVGVSIVLSSEKLLSKGVTKKALRKKIAIRSLKIFGLGIFLNLFPSFDFGNLRIPGVLQRIAIVYFVCAHLFLICDLKSLIKVFIGALFGYWFLMIWVPVPGVGAGVLEPGKNLAAYLDSILIPGSMWQGTWDPEGVLSTIPAVGTGIAGMFAAFIIKRNLNIETKLTYLFFTGFLFVIIGYAWDLIFPINKNLWTSSFVMFTAGWAFMALAASILVVDVKGYHRIAKFGVIYGSNSIAIYVLAGMLPTLLSDVLGVRKLFFNGLVEIGMNSELASALWAIAYTLICFIPALILNRKKIFIKV